MIRLSNISIDAGLIVLVGTAMLCGCRTVPNGNGHGSPTDQNKTTQALNYVVPDHSLTASDIAKLESSLSSDPDDIKDDGKAAARLKGHVDLLWHYRNQFADPSAEAKANSYLLWIVTHHPDAKVLGTPIAQLPLSPGDPTADVFAKLWSEQSASNGRSARVQGHAGLFYKEVDPERALRLFELAHGLDAKEPLWLANLGDLYASRAKSQSLYRNWATKAIDAYQKALPLLKSTRAQQQLLPKLALMQLRVGQLDAAAKSADIMAEQLMGVAKISDDQAVSLHAVHIIRGLIADARSDQAGAADELAKAAAALKGHRASLWQLDMALADRLQSGDQRFAVILYLVAIHATVKDPTLMGWISELKRGEKADFKSYQH